MDTINEGISKSVKNKLKQGLSAFDLLTTVVALGLVAAFTVPLFSGASEAKNLESAKLQVSEISEKLTKELRYDSSKNDNYSGRMPASAILKGTVKWEGLVSKDPWGQYFSYRVLKDAYGLPTHILVWSKGPNGVQDTPDSELRADNSGFKPRMDDLGHLKSIY